jgi:hypothetical protein
MPQNINNICEVVLHNYLGMKSTLLIFFIFFQTRLFTQSSFDFQYQNNLDYFCSDVLEIPGHQYVLSIVQVNTVIQQLVLVKLGGNGDVILSQQIIPPSDDVVYFRTVEIPSGYLVFGVQKTTPESNGNLYFLRTDKNFQVITSGTITSGLPSTGAKLLLQVKKDIAGNILVLGTKLGGGGNFLSIFNSEGTFLSIDDGFPFTICGTFFDISPTPNDQLVGVAIGAVCVLDSMLNAVKHADQEPFSMQSTCLFAPIENAIYIAGRHQDPWAPVDDNGVIVLKYNENLQKTAMAVINAMEPDTIIYPATSNGIQRRANGEILVAGTWNIDYTTLWSSNKSFFFLSQLDTALSVLVTRKFGGDAYYHLYGVIPTSDGGCLMYGYRYYEANGMGLDPFVKKLGVVDLSTSAITDYIGDPIPNCQFFPNPGTDLITVNLPQSTAGQLQITSVTGQIFFTGQVKDKDQIQTHFWPCGYYFYQFSNSAGNISPIHKWVKIK